MNDTFTVGPRNFDGNCVWHSFGDNSDGPNPVCRGLGGSVSVLFMLDLAILLLHKFGPKLDQHLSIMELGIMSGQTSLTLLGLYKRS